MVLLLQSDITDRIMAEAQLSAVSEAQLAMLGQMFPRHVLEHLVVHAPTAAGRAVGGAMRAQAQLARSHPNVTVLFMGAECEGCG